MRAGLMGKCLAIFLLEYLVTPPSSAFGTNYFSGKVSFDGTSEVPIGGIRACWQSDGTIRLNASFITLLGDRFIKLTVGGSPDIPIEY
jgi:hypothetical protein